MPSQTFQLLGYLGKRPNNSAHSVKQELIEYVGQEVRKNHYPTKRELQNTFRLRIDDPIKDLYVQAGIDYVQENSQELKQKKAELLTRVVLDLLPRFGLELLEVTDAHHHGPDILAVDGDNRLIAIELKAYNKDEPVKKRNIKQLMRFLKQGFFRVLLLTTTSRIEKGIKLPAQIEIMPFEELRKMITNEQFAILERIRCQSIHVRDEAKEMKRQIMKNYAKKKLIEGCGRLADAISKDLHMDLYNYFRDTDELLLELSNDLPVNVLLKHGRIGRRNKRHNEALRQIVIDKFLAHMRREIRNGHYPTGKDLEKSFGVSHTWNFVTLKELYELLGQPPYHQRETRGKRLNGLKV